MRKGRLKNFSDGLLGINIECNNSVFAVQLMAAKKLNFR